MRGNIIFLKNRLVFFASLPATYLTQIKFSKIHSLFSSIIAEKYWPVDIQSYFDRDILREVLRELSAAEHSLQIALYSFNHKELIQKVVQKAEQGLQVDCIIDKEQHMNEWGVEEKAMLYKRNINLCLVENLKTDFANMHHKFCIIDCTTVITGSFNWTNNAAKASNENIVVIKNQTVAKRFQDAYLNLMKNAAANNPPAIIFTASNMLVEYGSKTTLSWSTPNSGNLVLLDNETVENSGQKEVSIFEDRKIKLKTAETIRTLSIRVVQPPTFEFFRTNQGGQLIKYGERVTLEWSVKNAANIRLVGHGKVGSQDALMVSPMKDTTYELTVEDALGKVYSAFASVKVLQMHVPTIEKVNMPTIEIKGNMTFSVKGRHLLRFNDKAHLYQILNEQSRKEEEVSEIKTKPLVLTPLDQAYIDTVQTQSKNTKTSIWKAIKQKSSSILNLVRREKAQVSGNQEKTVLS